MTTHRLPDKPIARLTARGVGCLAVFAVCAVLGITTRNEAFIPLVVIVGGIFLASPPISFVGGRRVLGSDAVIVSARPSPPQVEVGVPAALAVTVVPGMSMRTPRLFIDVTFSYMQRETVHGSSVSKLFHHMREQFTRLRRHLAPGTTELTSVPPIGGHGGMSMFRTEIELPTDRRGIVVISELHLRLYDPLGIYGVTVAIVEPGELVVYPGSGDMPGTIEQSPRGEGAGEFRWLRPYVPGDRLHLLDWATLARTNELFVRSFAVDTPATVHLVIDDRSGVHLRQDFDAVLSAVLASCDAFAEAGQHVSISTICGAEPRVFTTAARDDELLRYLATLMPMERGGKAGGIKRGGPAGAFGNVGEGVAREARTFPPDAMVLTTVSGAQRLPPDWRELHRILLP